MQCVSIQYFQATIVEHAPRRPKTAVSIARQAAIILEQISAMLRNFPLQTITDHLISRCNAYAHKPNAMIASGIVAIVMLKSDVPC